MSSSQLKLRVWIEPGSHGYWKVIDADGEALMTAFDSHTSAARWAERDDVERLHNGRKYLLQLQHRSWPHAGRDHQKVHYNPLP